MSLRQDLVNRRVATTRAEIREAGVALFHERGFDDTSMTAIAEAAGVSRRTLYRYFPSKDDIVFESPREWLAVFDAEMAASAVTEPLRDRFRRSILAVAAHISSRRERVVVEFALLASSATLLARWSRSDHEWITRYLELLTPEFGTRTLESNVCAMTLVAAQNALILTWATGPPEQDLVAMTTVALDQIDSVWPTFTR